MGYPVWDLNPWHSEIKVILPTELPWGSNLKVKANFNSCAIYDTANAYLACWCHVFDNKRFTGVLKFYVTGATNVAPK